MYQLSGRELYEGYVIEGIDCTKDYECIEFSNSETVNLGKAIGSVDENIIKKAQIYRTIETHLEKELRYHDKGIKVLSLFFIDRVEKYRSYSVESGELRVEQGLYAKMFEECYLELINKPEYENIRKWFHVTNSTLHSTPSKLHDGYFSQDKKGNYKNTKGETPIGSYNPDWAVFLEKDGEQKLYFILETKGTSSLFELRPTERLKINCGRKHFEALDGGEFSELPVKDWTEFKVNL